MSDRVLRFEARLPSRELAEQVLAEVWAAGTSGVEDEGTTLRIYAPAVDARRVREAARQVARKGWVGPLEPVEPVDWSREWKRGLTAQVISERLVVRPSFVTHDAPPGQLELIVEPGQAFGTGGHESTLLALQWLDALHERLPQLQRVLDVGTGSAVLAMAAVGLGASNALGIDIDAVAVAEARGNVARNGMADRIELSTEALAGVVAREAPFDLVLANLLKSEVMPLLPEIASSLRAGGQAIFSGLLASEEAEFATALAAVGLEVVAQRSLPDSSRAEAEPGPDWIGLLVTSRPGSG